MIHNVGLNPTRIGILSVMTRMGAKITERIDNSGCEPMGSIEVVGNGLVGTEIGGAEIPTLIDESPVLAVAAALAEGKTVIKDAILDGKIQNDRAQAWQLMLETGRALGKEPVAGMEQPS